MEEQIAFCEQIDLSVLKPEIGPFRLVIDKKKEPTQYLWFHYENDRHWKWQVLYDKEVEDFTVQVQLPLVSFNCISFIKPKGEVFWEHFLPMYEAGLTDSLVHPEHKLCYEYRKKKIPEWEYEKFLPDKIGEYILDITPDKGIMGINGSYLIASYVHTSQKSGLTLCYNIMRDDFFAELCKDGNAIITHELDATTLQGLEKVLQHHLEKLLVGLNP